LFVDLQGARIMSDAWYYQSKEQVPVGPVRPGELLKLVRSGTVQEQTLLRKGDSAWFPAAQVGGLFASAAKPATHDAVASRQAVVADVDRQAANAVEETMDEAREMLQQAKSRVQGWWQKLRGPSPGPARSNGRTAGQA
jgi:hypothetical protein